MGPAPVVFGDAPHQGEADHVLPFGEFGDEAASMAGSEDDGAGVRRLSGGRAGALSPARSRIASARGPSRDGPENMPLSRIFRMSSVSIAAMNLKILGMALAQVRVAELRRPPSVPYAFGHGGAVQDFIWSSVQWVGQAAAEDGESKNATAGNA